jgi:type IV pilus assembly protein PilC
MPRYRYTAIDLSNNKTSGFADAKDEGDFRKLMRGKNLVPVNFKDLKEKRAKYRLKANEAAEFSRQLAGMLNSGITAARAMEIMKNRDFKPKLKAVFEQLYKDVQKGFTLSETMRSMGRCFPELLVNMYASGEASGQLERVASKMGTHYEKEHRLNGKVKSAMTYPKILMAATVAVVLGLFIFVLPELFETMANLELPAITRFIIAISGLTRDYWYAVLIAAAFLAAGLKLLKTVPGAAYFMAWIGLKAPVAGPLMKIIYTARFARTLSSLYSSGVSMIRALEITGTTIGNKYIEAQFGGVIKDVRNGEPLSESIRKIDGFDTKLSDTILIGEESGRLDTMLVSIAESFDYESEAATERLVKLVEPAMLVLMAVIIGTIMISVMLPMMTLYQNASGI